MNRKASPQPSKSDSGPTVASALNEQVASTDTPPGSASPARWKKWGFPIGAVLFGLIVACLGVEVGLRVFHVAPVRYPQPRWLVWDGKAFRESNIWGDGAIKRTSRFAEVGATMGEYVPGAVFKIAYASNPTGYLDEDNGARMSINSVGLRGEEISAQKPAGTYRILGVGDSVTFGVGVRDDDTFLHRLQLRLNTNAPAGRRYEVLNAGVQGYNTRDEVICLENRWADLAPDLVVIFFYINDAYDDRAILNMGQEFAFNEKPSFPARCSYLWDMAEHTYKVRRNTRAMEAYYQKQYFSNARTYLETPQNVRVDWKTSRGALREAARFTRDRNIKFAVVMFPELYKLQGGYPFTEIHALVRETCEQEKIPFLDLFETLAGHDEKKLWVHPTDHHPNAPAHAMVAASLEKFVRAQFLTPPPGAAAAAQ